MTREDVTLVVLLTVAVVLLSIGGALIYLPVGLLAGGLVLLGIVAAYVRGAAAAPPPPTRTRRRPRPRPGGNPEA